MLTSLRTSSFFLTFVKTLFIFTRQKLVWMALLFFLQKSLYPNVFLPQCKLFVKYLQSGSQRDAVHLLVLLLRDVWGLLKLMFSYTLDESSFVTLQQRHSRDIHGSTPSPFFGSMFCDHMFKIRQLPPCRGRRRTYTEEERDDATLGLGLELVVWGYWILEYSLSFSLFLCNGTTHESDSVTRLFKSTSRL